MLFKTLIRSVKDSFGHYMAIVLIIALGVGFFTGIKSTEPAMRRTAQAFFTQQNHFDFQLLSTLGLTESDRREVEKRSGVEQAEGGYRCETMAKIGTDNKAVLLYSLPNQIARPKVVAGRLPEDIDECVADARVFTEADLGKKITVEDPDNLLYQKEYTIVGLVYSTRYFSRASESTALGDGKLAGFFYVMKRAFASDVYHEISVTAEKNILPLDDGYAESLSGLKNDLEDLLKVRAQKRYDDLKTDGKDELAAARKALDDGWAQIASALSMGVSESAVQGIRKHLDDSEKDYQKGIEDLDALSEPEVHLLDNDSNVGYANFKNDSVIIENVADVFPIFFILIAALVCATTMTRMVHEERTQIGTLKAIGYEQGTIAFKYVGYALSAGLIGSLLGLALGTTLLPRIVWIIFGIRYCNFVALKYIIAPVPVIICLIISVFGSALVAYFTCRQALAEKPATLMRPKVPNKGKRILLERITPLWRRLSFLNKVMLRNAFRYKKRMLMMLIGISGCTALLVAGFGLRDTITGGAAHQYNEVQLFDGQVLCGQKNIGELNQLPELKNAEVLEGYTVSTDIIASDLTKESNVIVLPEAGTDRFFDFHQGETKIAFPKKDEAIVTNNLAEKCGLSVGSRFDCEIEDKAYSFTVSGICDNYLDHYVYINYNSIPDLRKNMLFYRSENADEVAVAMRKQDQVQQVRVVADEKAEMDKSMGAMNYVVIVLIVCAGALAFIVQVDLTNINIMERMREVATVKVLGFTGKETASYVLRENIMLSVIGGGIGLILGKLLHWFIMSKVNVDMMSFDQHIAPYSFILSMVITLVFTMLTNAFMRIKLEKINMVESLKAVE